MMKKTIFILLFLATASLLYAQLQIGHEPDVPSAQTWDFIKYGAANANLHTGMINVSIPFYTYKDKDFEIAISFDYASDGFKPNSISGILGHNWVLNVGGCITREVRGIPDDTYGYVKIASEITIPDYGQYTSGSPCKGFYYLHSLNCAEANDVQMTFDDKNNIVFYHDISMVNYDVEPDMYHFNFMGYSGSFYFWYNGETRIFHANSYNGEFKIKMNTTNYTSPTDLNNNFYFSPSIEITTGNGYKYFFGDPNPAPNLNNPYDERDRGKFCFRGIDYKTHQNPLSSPNYNMPAPIVNTWKLTKITAPNGRTVTFNYGEDGKDIDSYKVFEYYPTSTATRSIINIANSQECSLPSLPEIANELTNKLDSCRLYTDYLTSIQVDGLTYINLFYKNLKGEKLRYPSNNAWEYRIKQIEDVYLKLDSIDTPWKSCSLRYKYPAISNSTYYPINKIPFLDSIKISGEGSYVFEYYNRTDKQFPYIGSFSLDHWGYYNGRNESNPPVDLATIFTTDIDNFSETIKSEYIALRESTPASTIMGMLSWIKYPTGGYSVLHYEPHKYSTAVKRLLAYDYEPVLINVLPEKITGGLRIKQIDNYTSNNDLSESNSYIYEKEDGTSSGTLTHFPRYGINYKAALLVDTQHSFKIYYYKSLGNVLKYQNKFISLQLKIKNDDTPIRNIVSSLPKQ